MTESMIERREVLVRLEDWTSDFCETAEDFISALQKHLAAVPEQFRSGTIINFSRYGDDYDVSRGELSLYYYRQETDEELNTRREYDENSKKRKIDDDLRALAALKAKYER